MTEKKCLFELLGGRETLEKVHKIFYDKIYADSWIGQFFANTERKHIENQQTDFMSQAMDGPEKYYGALPIPAHMHINITTELFKLRSGLLADSLKEAGVPPELALRWIKIDGAFEKGIVKKSLNDCEKRYFTDTILDFKDPRKA
ncbi:MAG: group I truncated hemoglobin [Bdellovibrionota bacterium]